MRFRTNIHNVDVFHKLAHSIATLQKRCILRFTENTLHIICRENLGGGSEGDSGIQVWSQVKVSTLFTDYRIQSNANNEISLLLSSDALLAALKAVAGAFGTGTTSGVGSSSGFEANDVVMKLAKKNDMAVLTFEVSLQSRGGRDATVSHDVRIEVQKPADIEKMKEPLCPEPDVHVLLPPLAKLRTAVERMRSLSDVLAVRSNQKGCLQLAVRTDSVAVEIQWTNLKNPNMAPTAAGTQSQATQDDPDESMRDPEAFAAVHVSIKTFMKFLAAHIMGGTTIAAICHHHCIILYVYLGDTTETGTGGVLTFYVPALLED